MPPKTKAKAKSRKKKDVYELVFCKTKQDYIDMYTNNIHSCMQNPSAIDKVEDIHSRNYNLKFRDMIYFHHKIWPSVFYYHCPNTKGVVLKHNGKTVARTLLLKDKRWSKFKCYSELYGDSLRLRDELDKLGYKGMENINRNIDISKFNIPPIKTTIGLICPLPYADDVSSNIRVGYDTKLKKFVVGGNVGRVIDDWYDYENYCDTRGNSLDIGF